MAELMDLARPAKCCSSCARLRPSRSCCCSLLHHITACCGMSYSLAQPRKYRFGKQVNTACSRFTSHVPWWYPCFVFYCGAQPTFQMTL